MYKNWTIEQWNKVLWNDESKFKILGLNRKVYWQQRVGERAAILCITPIVKQEGDSVIGGDFCLLQSRGFALGEGQIE